MPWRAKAETRFDRPPPARIIGVPIRQSANGVKMIGQRDGGIDGEGPLFADIPDNRAQQIGMSGQPVLASVPQGDSEKVRGPGNAGTTIIDHATGYRGEG